MQMNMSQLIMYSERRRTHDLKMAGHITQSVLPWTFDLKGSRQNILLFSTYISRVFAEVNGADDPSSLYVGLPLIVRIRHKLSFILVINLKVLSETVPVLSG